MECPFELPVKFCAYIPVGDSPVDNGYIDDAKGNPIIIPILREQADYLVQAINSHEKLTDALAKKFNEVCEHILSDLYPKLKTENKSLRKVRDIAHIKLEAIRIRTKASENGKDKGNKSIWVIAKTGLEEIEQTLKEAEKK